MAGTEFIRVAIDEELSRLRQVCALKKEALRHALDPQSYWGTDSGSSTYWADLKAKCAVERRPEYDQALQALATFITEHRPIMGPGWIGNDHGRLCWVPYLGGVPIDQHYCHREEGHEGNHCNDIIAWPQGVRKNG